jgi:hypothetical protein
MITATADSGTRRYATVAVNQVSAGTCAPMSREGEETRRVSHKASLASRRSQ